MIGGNRTPLNRVAVYRVASPPLSHGASTRTRTPTAGLEDRNSFLLSYRSVVCIYPSRIEVSTAAWNISAVTCPFFSQKRTTVHVLDGLHVLAAPSPPGAVASLAHGLALRISRHYRAQLVASLLLSHTLRHVGSFLSSAWIIDSLMAGTT